MACLKSVIASALLKARLRPCGVAVNLARCVENQVQSCDVSRVLCRVVPPERAEREKDRRERQKHRSGAGQALPAGERDEGPIGLARFEAREEGAVGRCEHSADLTPLPRDYGGMVGVGEGREGQPSESGRKGRCPVLRRSDQQRRDRPVMPDQQGDEPVS